MARKPRQHQDSAASGQPAEGGVASMNTDIAQRRPPSAEAEEAVLRLARLVGRQIAREQFARKQVTKPNSSHTIRTQERLP
jgi:hypothetical protein